MLTKDEVAINLRKFANDNFKSLAELGRRLGMRPQNLQIYFEGRSYPGGQVLGRLSELGCDIDWLITGEVRREKYIPYDELQRVGLERGKMYKVTDTIPATIKELENVFVGEESLYYNEKRYLFLNVDEEMSKPVEPLINKGDKVLIDLTGEAQDKDIIVVKYESSKQEIRILAVDNKNSGMVILRSNSSSVLPKCVKRKNINMHRVVVIKKK